MIATLLVCASLTAVDGDTARCDGQLLRLLGEGVPFRTGIDTPEIGSHAKCLKERKLALLAKARLKEILKRLICGAVIPAIPWKFTVCHSTTNPQHWAL